MGYLLDIESIPACFFITTRMKVEDNISEYVHGQKKTIAGRIVNRGSESNMLTVCVWLVNAPIRYSLETEKPFILNF